MLRDWREVLGATVEMRLEACKMMYTGMNLDTRDEALYAKGRKLHSDAERIARQYRLK